MAYSAPKKSVNVWLWVLLGGGLLCLVVCGLGGLFGFQFFKGLMGQVGPLLACQVDIEASRNSLIRYAADHDGMLPPSDKWQDSIKPYFDEEQQKLIKESLSGAEKQFNIKFSNVDEVIGCRVKDGAIHAFAFNDTYSKKSLEEVKKIGDSILLFESTQSKRNAHGKYERIDPTADMTIMNSKRDWIRIGPSGDAIGGSTSKSNGRFE